MPNINETQRRYLKQRLQQAYDAKKKEILNKPASPFPGPSDKLDFIQSELTRVGLDWKVNYPHYIELPQDRAYQQAVVETGEKYKAKIGELTALYNSLMDKIMLGTDAQELTAALETLTNFK